jgi:hypothetical protein
MELNYYEIKKEKIMFYQKEYYKNHLEELKQYQKMYYESHKDYYKNYQKQYYQDHKEYFKKLNSERYYKYKEQGLIEKYKKPKVKPNFVKKATVKHDKPIYSYRSYKRNKIKSDLKKNAEKAEQFKLELLNQSVSPNK